MSKKALICGSYAFDNIMVFHDKFKNHILPDQVHILNVSFLVPTMRKEFGGCAGNIAYNLKMLSGEPVPMATVGEDFTPYLNWLEKNSIDVTHIKRVNGAYTGQAFITTDMDDNQITAFHPGAMSESHVNKVSSAKDISIGVISPDGRRGMLEHATQFVEEEIPFLFDPGQGMPMFSGEELLNFIEQATYVAVNAYEGQMLQEKTGLSAEEIATKVDTYIVTKSGQGSEIYNNGKKIVIGPIEVKVPRDPTGCGDAYRAGILFGIMNELDWETTGKLASVLGAIKVGHLGTQNHSFDIESIKILFRKNYGYDLEV
jgi:adenosine kinase